MWFSSSEIGFRFEYVPFRIDFINIPAQIYCVSLLTHISIGFYYSIIDLDSDYATSVRTTRSVDIHRIRIPPNYI